LFDCFVNRSATVVRGGPGGSAGGFPGRLLAGPPGVVPKGFPASCSHGFLNATSETIQKVKL
jgi:hypothetical protein